MSVYAIAKNAEPGADPKSYLVALKDYIPAEGLAIYIFLLGWMPTAADATRLDVVAIQLFCLGLAMVVAAVIAVATFKADVRGKGLFGKKISEKWRRRLVVIGIAWSALAAYVLATLEPLGITLFTVDVQRPAAAIGIGYAAILPYVAEWLGVRGTKADN